jgi:hypothetical protein
MYPTKEYLLGCLAKSEPDSCNVIDTKTDTQANVYIENRIMYIQFEHTASFKDWLTCFNFAVKPYKKMKTGVFFVHSGMIKSYQSVRDKILEKIIFLKNQFDSIQILGVSLGGGLGALCYEDLLWHKMNEDAYKDLDVRCVTFGAPKVFHKIWGWKKVAERCKDYINVSNRNDVVSRIPFSWLFYKRVGTKLHLGHNPSVWPLLPSSFYHHSPLSYGGMIKDPSFKDSKDNNGDWDLAWKWAIWVNIILDPLFIAFILGISFVVSLLFGIKLF